MNHDTLQGLYFVEINPSAEVHGWIKHGAQEYRSFPEDGAGRPMLR